MTWTQAIKAYALSTMIPAYHHALCAGKGFFFNFFFLLNLSSLYTQRGAQIQDSWDQESHAFPTEPVRWPRKGFFKLTVPLGAGSP